jgi:hypothetical protein
MENSNELLKRIVEDKLQDVLQKEWCSYNEFLIDNEISVLPDNHYKNGKVLNYEDIAKLRNDWNKSQK